MGWGSRLTRGMRENCSKRKEKKAGFPFRSGNGEKCAVIIAVEPVEQVYVTTSQRTAYQLNQTDLSKAVLVLLTCCVCEVCCC